MPLLQPLFSPYWMVLVLLRPGSLLVSPLSYTRKVIQLYLATTGPSPVCRLCTRSSLQFWVPQCGSICVQLTFWLRNKLAAHLAGEDAVISCSLTRWCWMMPGADIATWLWHGLTSGKPSIVYPISGFSPCWRCIDSQQTPSIVCAP